MLYNTIISYDTERISWTPHKNLNSFEASTILLLWAVGNLITKKDVLTCFDLELQREIGTFYFDY